MQEFRPSVHNQSPSLPTGTLHTVRASFTPLRVGLLLAAALLIATAIIVLRGGAAGLRSGDIKREQSSVRSTTPSEVGQSPAPSTSSTTFSATTTNGNTNTHLTVNGQDVPVPTDGASHQTTVDQNGAHTSVTTSTSQSSVSNTSTFNVHVSSSSSITGDASQ